MTETIPATPFLSAAALAGDLEDWGPLAEATSRQQVVVQETRAAVLLHMYEEEGTWFPLLKERVSEMDQRVLTTRFLDEYRRYTHAAG